MSLQDDYRRLVRLKAKRARLQKHINALEKKLAGLKFRWRGCADGRNRR
jgi:hypothetical protein